MLEAVAIEERRTPHRQYSDNFCGLALNLAQHRVDRRRRDMPNEGRRDVKAYKAYKALS